MASKSYVVSGYSTPEGINSAEDVRNIQKQLIAAGYSVGKTGADGIWGKNTQAAYEQYMAAQKAQDTINELKNMISGLSGRISEAYANAASSYQAALDSAYALTQAQVRAQAEKLAKEYEALRTQAYAAARISAIGNNELLAAKGLAGSLYGDARSGASETSRVAGDIALRENLNNVSLSERQAMDALEQGLIEAAYERAIKSAQFVAHNTIAEAQSIASTTQQQFQNALKLMELEQKLNANPSGTRTSSAQSSAKASASAYLAQARRTLDSATPAARRQLLNDAEVASEIIEKAGYAAYVMLREEYLK